MELWDWAVKFWTVQIISTPLHYVWNIYICNANRSGYIWQVNTANQNLCLRIFFPMTQQPLVDQVFLIIMASLSNSDTPHSVGLLWTSGQPDAETSTWQYTTITRDSHICPGGIRTHHPSERPQTHALDCSATRIGVYVVLLIKIK